MRPVLLFAFAALSLLAGQAFAQAPQRFQYQAVARSANGDLLANQTVALRLSILDGSTGGPVLYQETHAVTTNTLGLFAVPIGGGSVQSGSMNSINWGGGAKFIRVEMDAAGGNNFVDLGVSQLLSVPYALHAASGGTLYTAGAGIQISGTTITNTGDGNPNDDLVLTTQFAGDISGTYDNLQIKTGAVGSTEIADQSVTGQDLHPMGAANGDVLKWDGAVWAPAADLQGGGGAYTAGTGISIAGNTISALNDNVLWNALKLYGRDISSAAPAMDQVLKWNGSLWAPADDETGGGGGYMAGSGISITGNTINALTNDALWNAVRLQGRFVADMAPVNGQTLVWNDIMSRWEPQTLSGGGGIGGSGNNNFIPKFTGTNTLGNSVLYETTGALGLSTTAPAGKLHVKGTADQSQLVVQAHTTQMNASPLIQIRAYDGSELIRLHSDYARNLYLGRHAGMNNQVIPTTSGEANTFLGAQSGELNTGGSNNSAVGFITLNENTSGSNNSALGSNALRRNTTGAFNSALGAFVLENNTTGQFNTSLGTNSMNANTQGSFNTAVGSSALNGNNAGTANTAVGYRSMFNNATGTRNVAIGTDALYLASIGNYNVAVGTHAMYLNSNRSYNVAIGDSALYSNSFGAVDISQATGNTAVGSKAMRENTTGSDNTALGYQAMINGQVGSRNTAIGTQTLLSNQFGEENTATGYRAMYLNQLGVGNTGVGMEAMFSNNSGDHNTGVGKRSLFNNTVGDENTATGYFSLEANQTGQYNVGVGAHALKSNNAAHYSTAVGAYALEFSNADGNTALGYKAGGDYVQGIGNTYIGFNAKTVLSGYDNSVALGSDVVITGSNMVRIGNGAVTSIGGPVNWTVTSDARVKTGVREDVRGLEFILRLRPVTYQLDLSAADRITGAQPGLPLDRSEQQSVRYTGFIAQEVEEAARETGYDFSGVDLPAGEKDLYGIRYAEFVAPLVQAVKEQQALIEAQGDMIRQLKEELEALRKKGQ